MIDLQVCFNEITWTVSKVVRNMEAKEVRGEIERQAIVVFEPDRICNTWITNRKSVAVFIRGARWESKDKNEEVQEKLEAYNPAVQWGDRKAVATRIGAGEWGVKTEVVSAEEAVRMVKRGLWWNKMRHEVELWSTAGQRVAQNPSTIPTKPRTDYWSSHWPKKLRYPFQPERPHPNTHPHGILGRLNVQCYACRKWGHFARVCNSNSRNMSVRIGERGQKRPIQSPNKA